MASVPVVLTAAATAAPLETVLPSNHVRQGGLKTWQSRRDWQHRSYDFRNPVGDVISASRVAVVAAAAVGFKSASSSSRRSRLHGVVRTAIADAASTPQGLGFEDLAKVLEMPPKVRRDGKSTPRIDWDTKQPLPSFKHYSLAELFSGEPLLAEVFNADAEFRRRLRVAMRADLYTPVPKLSEEDNAGLREIWMDLEKPHVKAPLLEKEADADSAEGQSPKLRPLSEVSALFSEYNLRLTGEEFVQALLRLGNLQQNGRFSDLVGKAVDGHRWHQDHGKDALTVMLGFPPENDFEGPGVFTHVLRLSHPMRLQQQTEKWSGDTPILVKVTPPEECILRPIYRPGQEIMVYRDSACLHSTPDVVNRQALWRFM